MLRIYLILLTLLLIRASLSLNWFGTTSDKPAIPFVFKESRLSIMKVYKSLLDFRQAEILAGVVLGAEEMDRGLRKQLVSAGMIHLVVASGMNLTLLGGFCDAIFTGLHFGRRRVVLFSSIAVILYGFLSGLNPPIVRAVIMFEAVMVGGLVGRKSGGLFGLLTAAYFMLWVNPLLVFSFSFLLSFASMTGQIFVSRIRLELPALLSAIVLVVLQNGFAIVFTLPIVLFGFGQFSLVSMITNILVVWMIEPLMIGGALAGIAGLISLDLARFLLAPLAILLDFFLAVSDQFGSEGRFVLKIGGFNFLIMVGYYLLLGVVIYKIAPNGKRQIHNANAH